MLEANPKDTVDRLEQLHAAGILEAELVDTIFTCSACKSPDLHPQQICPSCDGSRLVPLEIIEHFTCGHISPRSEFETEKGDLRCPSCGKKLEAEQRDYKIEKAIQCLDCKNLAQKPKLVFRCFKCQAISSDDKLRQHPLNIYRLNMIHRGDIIHYLGYHPTPEAEKPSRLKHRKDLDDVDRRILNILQKDARLSFRNVARKLRVSDATIRHRVARLQKEKVITNFTTLLDPQKAGMEVICLVHLEVKTKAANKLVHNLTTTDEVKLVMETGERQNLIVLAVFPTRQALNDFLDQYIRNQPGVQLDTVTVALNLRKFDWMIHL